MPTRNCSRSALPTAPPASPPPSPRPPAAAARPRTSRSAAAGLWPRPSQPAHGVARLRAAQVGSAGKCWRKLRHLAPRARCPRVRTGPGRAPETGRTSPARPVAMRSAPAEEAPMNGESPVLDTLTDITVAAIEHNALAPRELMLVRMAALIAVDAPPASYLVNA